MACPSLLACSTACAFDPTWRARRPTKTWAAELLTRSDAAPPGQGLAALVNNAALQVLRRADSLNRDDWHRKLDLDLLARFVWTQALLPELNLDPSSVVNISSIQARLSKKVVVACAASKAELRGMTCTLAQWASTQRVGRVIPCADSERVLFGLQQGFALAALDDGVKIEWLQRVFEDQPALRWNDTKADASGALWAGRLNNGIDAGGDACLFRPNAQDSLSTRDTGCNVADVLAISPDGRELLHTASGRRCIDAVDLDAPNRGVRRPRARPVVRHQGGCRPERRRTGGAPAAWRVIRGGRAERAWVGGAGVRQDGLKGTLKPALFSRRDPSFLQSRPSHAFWISIGVSLIVICRTAEFFPDSEKCAARPNLALARRSGSGHVEQQQSEQRAEVRSMVEAVGEGTREAAGGLAEGEVLLSAVDGSLRVTQEPFDPLEAWQLTRLALPDHVDGVGAARIVDRCEAARSIVEHVGDRQQFGARPSGDGTRGEAGHLCRFGVSRQLMRNQLHRDHKRHLVRQAAPDRAGGLTAEVAVFDGGTATLRHLCIGRGHDTYDLAVRHPSLAVAHPRVPHQRRCRRSRLGVSEQVHRQELHAQRQPDAVKQGAAAQRRLVPAGAALQHRSPAVGNAIRFAYRRAWADEADGRALAPQCVDAVCFGTSARRELGKREAALELILVARHGDLREPEWKQVEMRQAKKLNCMRFVMNQVRFRLTVESNLSK